MELEHQFTVPVGADEAFAVLRDIQRIGPCMPGATIESVDGEEFTGRVKVKVGPMQITYRGTARFVDVDEQGRSATIEAKGSEARGSGTARATIRAALEEQDGETTVRVVTDLTVTGKPAQFGRGVMADVGDKLLGRFAECLAEELAGGGEDAADVVTPEPAGLATKISPDEADPTRVAGATGTAGGRAVTGIDSVSEAVGSPAEPPRAEEARPRRTDDAIDLLDVAGLPVAKRLAPAAVLVLLAVLVWLLRRNPSDA